MDATTTGLPGESSQEDPSTDRDIINELSRSSESLGDRLITWAISVISNTAIVAILLIFIFLTAESLPISLQLTNNAHSGQMMDPAVAAKKDPRELAAFLQTSEDRIKKVSPSVLGELIAIRNDELKQDKNPDSRLNTTSWRMLLLPFQWHGYDHAVFVWQPIGHVEKYNLVPLFFGTLKVASVALVLAIPLAIIPAIYLSQLASIRTREIIKPLIELLASIPSVVLGFLGMITLSSLLAPLGVLDSHSTPLNTLVAGVALALAVVPVIFTIAEDALSAVPNIYKNAARALGATEWHATMGIVVRMALPGIGAAVTLGFARAIGETMIVLLASGNAATLDLSVFRSVRTASATIASELNEAAYGSAHYHVLFLIGTVLFFIAFLGNVLADLALRRLRLRLEGTAFGEAPMAPMPLEPQMGRTPP